MSLSKAPMNKIPTKYKLLINACSKKFTDDAYIIPIFLIMLIGVYYGQPIDEIDEESLEDGKHLHLIELNKRTIKKNHVNIQYKIMDK